MKKALPVIIIFSILIVLIIAYRNYRIEQVQKVLVEHSRVIAEPLWSFDSQQLEEYLDIIAEKYNYKELVVVNEFNDILHQKTYQLQDQLTLFLSRIKLVQEKKFEQEILFDNKVIGKIIVTWWDTSIFFYANSTLLALLLLLITHFYTKAHGARKSLEEKIQVINNQMIQLKQQKEYVEEVFNVIPEGLITLNKNGRSLGNNHSFEKIVNDWASITGKESADVKSIFLEALNKELAKAENGQYTMNLEDYTVHIDFSSSVVPSFQKIDRVVSLRDITKLASMERQLSQSQKLEAVGRLASGIAHEINTPTQYVLSNVDFLMDSHEDLAAIINKIEQITTKESKTLDQSSIEKLVELLDEADWEFLKEEIPTSIEQSREGLRRIANIVSAMKHFSHPSGDTPEFNDINSAIENTVSVARNEWKYVADVQLELSPHLPQIRCFLDELNQVFLGMIVNSAHSIEEKYGEADGKKGEIIISTQVNGDDSVIIIKDNGGGMPSSVAEKVFDPFFTTKEVNKGTGQGLAIAHDVIVNRHQGTISVQSTENEGTTFTITLPHTSKSNAESQ